MARKFENDMAILRAFITRRLAQGIITDLKPEQTSKPSTTSDNTAEQPEELQIRTDIAVDETRNERPQIDPVVDFCPALESYFKAIHIYKCLCKPERVRWHLQNWEQRNGMDWLYHDQDKTSTSSSTKLSSDAVIPGDAEYVIVAEDIICEPHYGSAIFFASKQRASSTYGLKVGFYYAYEKTNHYCFASQKEWADECCDGVFAVFEKHETLRPLAISYRCFARLFRQCGRAINAEFAARSTCRGSLRFHGGPHCRRVYRRKAAFLDQ